MKRYLSVIVLVAILAFLIRLTSAHDWIYLITAILGSYAVIVIIEKYRKLNAIVRYAIYIIVGVPIMSNVIPLYELFVLTAVGLAYTIIDYATHTADENKK